MNFLEQKLEFISKNCSKVLNLGAGIYDSSREFFSGPDYKTLDLNPENKPDIVADAHSIPVKDGVFEAVLGFSLLEHTHSPHVVAEEIFRVLKPGGYILMAVPFIHPYHGGRCPDYYRFTKDGLGFLFRRLKSVEIHSDGGFFYALQFFTPAFLRLIQFLIRPLLIVLDKLFTRNRASAHNFILFAQK